MVQVQLHRGPLPDPISVLESYLKEGGISLLHASFANSFFVDPDAPYARARRTTRTARA